MEGNHLCGIGACPVGVATDPVILDLDVGSVGPSCCLKPLPKGPYSLLPLRIVGDTHEHRDPPHSIEPLLCARTEGPHDRCRAAEQRDERAAFHSITSSASASSLSGILRPSAFAVLRLITNANLMDCITGRSAGFSPLRIRPA